MTAPAPSVRLTPAGRKLGRGYITNFAIALDLNIELFEDSVTPSGFDSDTPDDITSQHNLRAHTFSPGGLMTDTPVMLKCKYDPIVMQSLRAIANIPTTGTTHFPDGSTYAQYGWIKSAKPSELVRGTVPTIDVEFFVSSTDPILCTEEMGVYTAGSGTAPSC